MWKPPAADANIDFIPALSGTGAGTPYCTVTPLALAKGFLCCHAALPRCVNAMGPEKQFSSFSND